MKTTTFSLALAAGASSALAADPPVYGDPSSAPAVYGSASSSEYAPVSSSAYASSSSYYPVSSSAFPVSASSSYYPVSGSSASYSYAASSSAYPVSASSSYYPVSGSSAPVVYGSGSSSYPGAASVSSVPAVYDPSSSAAPYTSTDTCEEEGSTVPAVYPSSAVYDPTSVPAGYPSSPVESGPVVVTNTVTNTKYVCPCETAKPTRTPGEIYTTEVTTEYVTTCPGNEETGTFTYGEWTSIYTKHSLSTATYTHTKTLTEPAGYPTGYPVPSGYASGTEAPYPSSASSSYAPTGTACVPCQGQPGKNPEEWCGYTIHDDWYDVVPKTCRTVEYHWTVTNEIISPDGVPRYGLAVNGQMPGPMIEANWGDEIVIHLTNGLDADLGNGTSLHFHGIRMNGTNEMDGVSSITQCPIAPGSSMTYRWRATSYGTSWWHSHYGLQTYDGMFGPMIINGPASAEYDEEQMVMLQDWSHIPVDTIYAPSVEVANQQTSTPTLDTGLINGMNLWEGQGKRFEMTVESGKSYRLRLVNTAIQSTFVFYVDQHVLEVIAMDFVPITPYTTDKLVINIGQRYDVILKADQPAGDYWLRSDNQQPCGPLINLDIKGIVHYADGPNAEPTSAQYQYAPTCLDEPLASLVPIVPKNAGAASQTVGEVALIGPGPTTPNLFKWTLSGTTFYAEWDNPTLESIYTGSGVPTTSGSLAIQVPNLGEWVYIIIQSPIPLPHPIHLHGHDFMILAQGLGAYDSSVPLQLNAPARRDVAVMPADPTTGTPGYLVLAYETSNPGVWLLHCHIGWHNAMGMALQIIENLEGIASTVKYGGAMEETCNSWKAYASQYSVVNTIESGV